MRCRIEASLEQLSVQAQNEQEAEVRAVVCVKGLICADCEEEIVTDALLACSRPGKAGEPAGHRGCIWRARARRFGISVKSTTFRWMECAEMNNLTQDEIRPGDQLLIVKGYAVDKEMQIV